MSLVPAICTQCGAKIEVDDTHEAGVCKHCGMAFITEKVIKKYEITNNIEANVVNIYNVASENEFETTGHTLTAYKGKDSIVNIPHHILIIGKDAFKGNTYIKEVILPEGLNEIGDSAFEECSSLAQITIPENVKIIGSHVFAKCTSLKQIIFPENVIKIGNATFYKCTNLQKVVLPEKLYVLSMDLFSGCTALKDINIPRAGTIGHRCFGWCTSLIDIEIPDSIYCIGENAFCNTNLSSIKFCNENVDFQGHSSLFNNSNTTPYIIASDSFKKRNKFYLNITDTSSKKGCYIATCVYGTYDCAEVWTLRRFRDYVLDATWYGRIFIKSYYAISPIVVKLFGKKVWFQTIWKNILDVMVVKLKEKGIKDTQYNDKY